MDDLTKTAEANKATANSEADTPWMEIFRAGDYGAKGRFTEADVKQIAESYDPAWHEAPAVKGHPKSDAPAYGWVSQLKAVGGTLMGKLRQVDPAFRESIDQGRFKKRSIALYDTSKFSQAAPVKGQWYLRHLGFLGAMPPEVKGLADAAFGQEEFQTIDFDEEKNMADEKSIKDQVVDALKSIFGGGTPPLAPAFSEDRVKELILAEQKNTEAKFAADLKTEREKREAVELEFSDYKKSQTMAGLSQRAKDAITALKTNKRWLPAYDHMGIPQLFHALTASNVVEIEFGEGDKKQKKDCLQLFADVLDGIGKIVPEGALNMSGVPGSPMFKEGVDPNSVLFDEAVKQRAKDKNLAYNDAFKELKAEGWKPSTPGASAAGAV